MLNDALIGFIRTAVPAAVGTLLAYVAAKTGVTEPLPDVGPFAVAVATAGYWVVVRYLESKVPSLGWLLGYAKPPTYLPAD